MTAKIYLIADGLQISYGAIHIYLRKEYGKADHCEFCNSKIAKRFEWALKSGLRYSININDYLQLCPSCHRKYDETEERKLKISISHKGKKTGERNSASKKVIDILTNNIYTTISEAAITLNIKRSTLSMMLTNKNKNKTNIRYL